jgi:hypothetical protein
VLTVFFQNLPIVVISNYLPALSQKEEEERGLQLNDNQSNLMVERKDYFLKKERKRRRKEKVQEK